MNELKQLLKEMKEKLSTINEIDVLYNKLYKNEYLKHLDYNCVPGIEDFAYFKTQFEDLCDSLSSDLK